MTEFFYEDMLPLGEDTTQYRLLTTEGVETVEGPDGRTFLSVAPETLSLLAEAALHDISHYLREEASANDKFVALDLLKNAVIAAGGVLPMCQDTGTAIVSAKRGQQVLTEGPDEKALSRGIYDAYVNLNLRYSQNAPLTMWDEKNTGNNLPAQIEIAADTKPGHEAEYSFLFMAKGGGSANKSYLYQETKALLNPERMMQFIEEKIRSLGTAACPPYHLALVIGGTSAEYCLKTAKYASAKYLDALPTHGDITGHGFRDIELEERSWSSRARSVLAPSSVASTSATMCVLSVCPATEPPCLLLWLFRAPLTASAKQRSPPKACSWKRWTLIRVVSCLTLPTLTWMPRLPAPPQRVKALRSPSTLTVRCRRSSLN